MERRFSIAGSRENAAVSYFEGAGEDSGWAGGTGGAAGILTPGCGGCPLIAGRGSACAGCMPGVSGRSPGFGNCPARFAGCGIGIRGCVPMLPGADCCGVES